MAPPSITNLSQLFVQAEADWNAPPPPPVEGGTPPQYASKAISVVASFVPIIPGGLPLTQGDLYSGALYYTPGRFGLYPASFSGRVGANIEQTGEDMPATLYLSIEQPVGRMPRPGGPPSRPQPVGYSVMANVLTVGAGKIPPSPPISLSWLLAPPGGSQGPDTPDQLVSIVLPGSSTVNGVASSWEVILNQYSFMVTLKK